MKNSRKVLAVLCAVSVTAMVLAAVPFLTNTFVGGDAGRFYDADSALGVASSVFSLFLPFILTILAVTSGLVFAKRRLTGVFIACLAVLAAADVVAPFLLHFVFSEGAGNPFSGIVMLLSLYLSLPANSAAYAFNDAVNLLFPHMAGGRVLVYIATLLTYLPPVLLSAGFLLGTCVRSLGKTKESKGV